MPSATMAVISARNLVNDMTLKEIKLRFKDIKNEADKAVLHAALDLRKEAKSLYDEEKFEDAFGKVVDALRKLREFSDFSHVEFRTALAMLLFDLSEIQFSLKDFKQSEKELEALFKVLEPLVKEDGDRFGQYHVLAMDLSTRILRSRKKTLELLAKQQINTGVLYEKVNAGVQAAIDKLVESLRRGAEMMAQTGDYRGAVRFYMEAIKLAKKRTGRVSRREVRMTVDMARVMMHSRSELARARRLLTAVLPHAVALENLDIEQEIITLLNRIDADESGDSSWKNFLDKVQRAARARFRRNGKKEVEKVDAEIEADEKAETEQEGINVMEGN